MELKTINIIKKHNDNLDFIYLFQIDDSLPQNQDLSYIHISHNLWTFTNYQKCDYLERAGISVNSWTHKLKPSTYTTSQFQINSMSENHVRNTGKSQTFVF